MNKLSPLLATSLVVCVASSFWLWRELRTERERADALQTRVGQLERSPAASTPLTEVNPSVAPLAAPRSIPEPAAPLVTAKSGSRAQLSVRDIGEYERQWLRNPKYREARRAQRRLELASGHLDLAVVLQISQDTADRLLDYFVDGELEYLSEAHPSPTNEEETRVRRLEIEEAQRVEDADLAALLGEAKVPQWKAYQASLQTRYQVHQLRETLSASAEPLREDQMEPLIAAIHAEQKQLNDEMADYNRTLPWSDDMGQSYSLRNERYAERSTAAIQRIHAEAASILSQQQLRSLDAMLQRQLDAQNARRRMEAARIETSGRGQSNVAKAN